MKKGKLYGIGVGPGDSKLLTVKAVEAIEQADMIITPKTEKKEGSVAFNIAKPYIPDTVEIFPMVFQMNTDMEAVNKQWEINRKLIQEKLDEGKNLVFLTLGDPMLYSTYMYIFNEFKDSEEYEVETIPGIPAFLGIASYIGLPVTEWEENVLIIPATCDPKKFDQALAACDNAVIMKVYKSLESITCLSVLSWYRAQDFLMRSSFVISADFRQIISPIICLPSLPKRINKYGIYRSSKDCDRRYEQRCRKDDHRDRTLSLFSFQGICCTAFQSRSGLY